MMGLPVLAAGQEKEPVVENLSVPPGPRSLVAYTSIGFSFVASYAGGGAWEIEVHADRSGTYRAKSEGPVDVPVKAAAITVSEATMRRLSGGDAKVAPSACETRTKNIAQTGKKTITYAMGPSLASCTFNYSDDAGLNDAAAAFQAMATTMQAGDRLKHKHRFDHLGLDAELDALIESVKNGFAIEVQNIAPILQSIVDDDEMMSPARRKAKTLLEMPAGQPVSAR